MNIKKILSTATAAFIGFASLAVPACSAAADSVVVLGDSIAAGHSATMKYGQIVADYLGADCKNFSKDGATTSDLLDKVKNDADTKAALKDAKQVLISIGGNDYLHAIIEVAKKNFDKTGSDSNKTILENMMADQANASSKIITALSDAQKPAKENIEAISAEIKSINPNANIVINSVYDPLEGINVSENPTAGVVASLLSSVISTFNSNLNLIDGITVAPVNEDFKGNISSFTFFNAADLAVSKDPAKADIHPTDAGQIKIAASVLKKITNDSEKVILGKVLGKLSAEQLAALPAAIKDGIDITPSTTEAPASSAAPADTTVTTVAPNASTTTVVTTTPSTSASSTSATTTTKVTNSPSTSDNGINASVFIIALFSIGVIGLTALRRNESK